MQQWREAREEASAAMGAPRGDAKISRCEAFLKKYPDYPQASWVMRALVEAYIDKGSFDPARLDSLLQQVAERESYNGMGSAEFLIDKYYFKHHLPLEGAERVLLKNREEIARKRASLASLSDANRRDAALEQIEQREVLISIAEARILLARQDAAGAIRKLLETEAADSRTGTTVVPLVDARGRVVRTLPAGHRISDRLNLTLASAYARIGKRSEAIARLDRVQDFVPGHYPEVGPEVEALRRELNAPAPEPWVVRAPPEKARDFRLKDLQGRSVALSDFRGRVVLTMFWTTW
jgi:hypothetical protein